MIDLFKLKKWIIKYRVGLLIAGGFATGQLNDPYIISISTFMVLFGICMFIHQCVEYERGE